MSNTHMHQSPRVQQFNQIMDDLLDLSADGPTMESYRGKYHGDYDFIATTFFRDHRTIGIIGQRQCGKTTWALTHSDDNTLIVVNNVRIRDQMIADQNAAFTVSLGPYPTIVTSRDVLGMSECGRKFKRIYVDDATYVFDGWDRIKFYKAIQPLCHDDTLIVMLG